MYDLQLLPDIADLNPFQNMYILAFFCVVLSVVCRGPAKGQSPTEGVLPNAKGMHCFRLDSQTEQERGTNT
jgi:hypothetical protein